MTDLVHYVFETLPVPIAAGALAALLFAGLWFNRHRHWPELESIARELGLALKKQGVMDQTWRLEGEYRGRPIDIHYRWISNPNGRRNARDPELVCTLRGVHPEVTILRHGLVTDVVQRARREVKIGDDELDRLGLFHGPEHRLRAAMDQPTRDRLTRLLRARCFTLQQGELQWVLNVHPERSGDLRVVLDPMCDLADALEPGPLPVERLLKLAEVDPEPEVRARCLLALLDEAPEVRSRALTIWRDDRGGTELAAISLLRGRADKLDALLSEPLIALAALDPRAVADALGRAGARLALTRLAQAEGGRSEEIRAAAAAALDALGGARSGALSLVDAGSEAGALSEATAGGAISAPKV